MEENELKKLLELSIHTAVEAGKKILKVYNSDDFEIELKSDNSPLTKADKLSHNIITEILSQTTFDGEKIPVLSEEGKDIPYEERKNWDLFWLVDPLDGTKEFIKRNGEFTVNIALLKNNEPILGVIYAPAVNGMDNSTNEFNTFNDIENDVVPNTWVKEFLDELGDFQGTLYFAASGVEVYKAVGNVLFRLSGQSSITQSNKLTAVFSRSHSSEDEKRKLEELGVNNFVSVGSSLKFCLVAEGKAQIYFRNGPTMEWDVGAGYSIAKESGAEIKGLSFNKENLLNSSFSVIKK